MGMALKNEIVIIDIAKIIIIIPQHASNGKI